MPKRTGGLNFVFPYIIADFRTKKTERGFCAVAIFAQAVACEEECKLYRERGVAEACAEADRRYSAALETKRAEAAAHADSVIKNTDKVIAEIVCAEVCFFGR